MKIYKENRPWGNFERFCKNENTTVKILQVNPNEQLSLQFHRYRNEFWKVIDGEGSVTLGEEVKSAKKGDVFHISKETTHRISTTNSSLRILEISFGHFDEEDIVRLEDKYNRDTLSKKLEQSLQ